VYGFVAGGGGGPDMLMKRCRELQNNTANEQVVMMEGCSICLAETRVPVVVKVTRSTRVGDCVRLQSASAIRSSVWGLALCPPNLHSCAQPLARSRHLQ
jgi:hypothetical protein